jgi:hypothetical protein
MTPAEGEVVEEAVVAGPAEVMVVGNNGSPSDRYPLGLCEGGTCICKLCAIEG